MNEDILRPLDNYSNQDSNWSLIKFLVLFALVIFLGTLIGFFVGNLQSKKTVTLKTSSQKKEGVVDKKTFRDQAEGILREGGINGEGSFHLERPGGASQNVYLTSSTVDLSKYVGKKVRVWGETFAGQKAGWLMDVGLIEIIQ
jgi:hypothetical protein